MKTIRMFLSENFHFFGGKTFSIFAKAYFRTVYYFNDNSNNE